MKRPTYEIEKETIDEIGPRNPPDLSSHMCLAPTVGRRNPNIPFHLRARLAGFENRPGLGMLLEPPKIGRMIGKTGNAGVETEAGLMDRIYREMLVAIALRQDRVDAGIT
jgi:hypothetical protein